MKLSKANSIVPKKFWSDQEAETEVEDGESDPRKDEDWKLQKRKGFLKDQENKNIAAVLKIHDLSSRPSGSFTGE